MKTIIKTKLKKPKVKIYEVSIPIKENWVFSVEATSRTEAFRMIKDPGSYPNEVTQICNEGYHRATIRLVGEKK